MPISSEIGSEWRTILGHPQLIECMGICVLSLAHGSELRGSDVYLRRWRGGGGGGGGGEPNTSMAITVTLLAILLTF